MGRDLALVMERLADRARADDAFAEALERLVDDSAPDVDPFARPGMVVLDTARRINAARTDQRRAAVIDSSLTTAEVVELIPTMSDRKAVDRRRRRGMLLGIKLGNTTYHPTWQFDRRRGDTIGGLKQILASLLSVRPDPEAANALMTMPNSSLGGRTIAGVVADGDLATALAAIQLAEDQS